MVLRALYWGLQNIRSALTHRAVKWSWSCSWYFHINLTENFFEVFCLGSLEFVRHLWHLGVFWGGCILAYLWVSKSVFSVLSPFQKSIYEIPEKFSSNFIICHFLFLFCLQGVTVQFCLFFSLTWFPDQITRSPIDLTALLKRKLNKDFKKVGPIRGNPSYKL